MKNIYFFLFFLLPFFANAQRNIVIEKNLEQGYDIRTTDTASAFAIEKKALNDARNINAKETMVQCYTYISITHRRTKNVLKMQQYADSAYNLAIKLNTTFALGYGYLARASFKDYSDFDKEEALDNFLKALDNFKTQNNLKQMIRVATDLSYFFAGVENEKQLKYANLAVEYAKKLGTADEILNARVAMGSYLYNTNKTNTNQDSVLNYLKETADFAGKNEATIYNKYSIAQTYINLAVAYQAIGNTADKDKCFALLDAALSLAIKYGYRDIYRNSFGIKGTYFLEKKDFLAAEKLFKEGIEIQNKLPYSDNNTLSKFYTSLKDLAIKKSDYKAYYEYDTTYEKHNAAYYNESSMKASQDAEAQYENKLKTSTINSLEKENKLQSNNKWLAIGAALLLGIALLLMFRTYHFKQKYFIETQKIVTEKQLSTELQLQIKQQESLEATAQKISMERRLLQSQMDPHFIFNALGNIQSFILQNDNKNAIAYLSRFSVMMRQILAQSKKEYITIEEEVSSLTNYIELQKLRLNNSFDYAFDLAKEINLETEIPPMLLQPLIENAIEHGLKPLNTSKHGSLQISFNESENKEQIICTVKDNGIGITQSKINNQNSVGTHQSMATDITKERLQNMAIKGKATSFSLIENIDSEGNITGTTATITIPNLSNANV